MITRYIYLVILATYLLPTVALAQYQLPKDKRYWKYRQWYLSHSIVSLVVSGKDEQHLSEVLSEIPKLKSKGILVGDVMVIGKNEQNSRLDKIADELNLGQNSMEAADVVVKKYKISSSPTWIVRYRGRDYVFEGFKSPQALFTSQGEFRGAE